MPFPCWRPADARAHPQAPQADLYFMFTVRRRTSRVAVDNDVDPDHAGADGRHEADEELVLERLLLVVDLVSQVHDRIELPHGDVRRRCTIRSMIDSGRRGRSLRSKLVSSRVGVGVLIPWGARLKSTGFLPVSKASHPLHAAAWNIYIPANVVEQKTTRHNYLLQLPTTQSAQ